MRKAWIIILFLLLCSVRVWGAEFKDTLKAAKQGDINAQFDIGFAYYAGRIISKDYEKADYWYKKAADKGHEDAQWHLDLLHREIEQLEILRAAENGDVNAQYNLALLFDKNELLIDLRNENEIEWEKNFEETLQFAEQGDSVAQYQMPRFLKGSMEAVHWYEKSANQGYIPAQYKLGLLCEYGNILKAIYWYEKAANQGYLDAQYRLGWIYENKLLTKDRKEKAIYWYRKAAGQGDRIALLNIEIMSKTRTGINPSKKYAFYWYEKAAKQGHVNAQYNLANIYYKGRIVPKNTSIALNWYKKAADQGHEGAKEMVSR